MNDVPRTRPTVETALYRIAQEALTNIAKHARAKNVRIELAERDGILTLAVEDDGVGFDASGWRGEGLGLRNMRERADAVGARIKVSSAAGAGTRVAAEVKV
jgi:signal transduction histidine kinase